MSNVKHPAHYGGINDIYEAIKVVEAWECNFNIGSALKYLCRAGRKTLDPVEDLEKAVFYIQREIHTLKNREGVSTGGGVTLGDLYQAQPYTTVLRGPAI